MKKNKNKITKSNSNTRPKTSNSTQASIIIKRAEDDVERQSMNFDKTSNFIRKSLDTKNECLSQL